MAKSKSQSTAFDIMAGINSTADISSDKELDSTDNLPVSLPPVPQGRAVSSSPKVKVKPRSKARQGGKPSERPLKACSIMLFEDQLRPCALLELDTGESRSELIRRLVDAELKNKGY